MYNINLNSKNRTWAEKISPEKDLEIIGRLASCPIKLVFKKRKIGTKYFLPEMCWGTVQVICGKKSPRPPPVLPPPPGGAHVLKVDVFEHSEVQ